jgi:threonine dehydratase
MAVIFGARQRPVLALPRARRTLRQSRQSLAYAARLFDARCVLVVPQGANPDKLAAMKALGAELIVHGRDFDEAKEHCEAIGARDGLRYVHSADEPDLIAGVGTYALEIFDQLPAPDVLIVPVGLGSGVCGAALVAAARAPATRVIGVQAVGASAVTQSWRSGALVETPEIRTFAEGMATRRPAVHDMVLVDDESLRCAIRTLLRETHNLAEGAGAAALAAAWQMREHLAGKTVGGVLSGGNLDLRELAKIVGSGNAV